MVLITFFEPFARRRSNLSAVAATRLSRLEHLGAVKTECLPVVYGTARTRIRALLEEFEPDCCILTGEHRKSRAVSVERMAVNVAHCGMPDNAGHSASMKELEPAGPLALMNRLDPLPLIRRLRRAGFPARISHHAGTFVCNAVYYEALLYSSSRSEDIPMVFLHLPGALPAKALRGQALAERLSQALEITVDFFRSGLQGSARSPASRGKK